MRATIAYYDPPERPAAEQRPDFTALPLVPKPVTVSDMRTAGGGFSLDREGFTLAAAPTAVRDFHDRDEVASRYIPEAFELVRSLTGATATALLNSPVVRVSSRVGTRPAGSTFTGDFLHADFSASATESMLRTNIPAGEVAERLRHRYSVFNVWCTFSGPPQDESLAKTATRPAASMGKAGSAPSAEPDGETGCRAPGIAETNPSRPAHTTRLSQPKRARSNSLGRQIFPALAG